MKAIVYTKYGPLEVLQPKEVEKPVPKENEAMLKVFAVSANPASLNQFEKCRWDLLIEKRSIFKKDRPFLLKQVEKIYYFSFPKSAR